jgi:hypothetical protein
MARSLSELAAQILQAATAPGERSLLPGFLTRPLAALATTDASGREGKGVSQALVREAIALFDASRKHGRAPEREVPDWRVSTTLGQAVQVLPPPLDDLQRRALNLAGRRVQYVSLNHPRLAPILEAAYREGYPYLVASLEKTARRLSQWAGLPLPPQQAFKITEQVMEALRYAHFSGFFHGRLSLDDILVDERGMVSVLGVGLEQLRLLAGAVSFDRPSPLDAPEVAAAGPLGSAADVYATAALLYVLLTGQAPKAGQPVRISQDVPGVPPIVDDVLTRALAADPADRYQDLSALSHTLRMAMHAARRPKPAAPRAARLTQPSPAQATRISGFPEPLPMPELDLSVFDKGLPMPTFDALPAIEMPAPPDIPAVDWNALLRPVDVSEHTRHSVQLPDFAELFGAVDPLHAAAKAVRDTEQTIKAQAAGVARPPKREQKAPKPQRRARQR